MNIGMHTHTHTRLFDDGSYVYTLDNDMCMNIVAMYTGHTQVTCMYKNIVAMYTGHSYKYVYECSCHVHRSYMYV